MRAATLGDQIRAEVITLLPEQPGLFEDIKPIDSATEFTAAGVLLANAIENEEVYASLMQRLWDETKDEAQLAPTTNVFVAALEQLAKGKQDEASVYKRSRVVAEITPKRIDRLRKVDKLYILATLAKTGNAPEVDYRIDPKSYTDFVISRIPFLGVDREALDAHTDVFANIIDCQPYYEQGNDLAEVVNYISFYFTSRSGRLNRGLSEEFEADKFEADTDDPDEARLIRALGSIKIQELFLGKTIRALQKHPDLYIAFVNKLLENGTSADTITEAIFDFPDDVDLSERLYDTLQGYPSIGIQHAKDLTRALIAAGRFEKAFTIIEEHGALEDTHETGPLLRDADFDGWGVIAAHFVIEAEKRGIQKAADTLTQKILCNGQLSGIFSSARRYYLARDLLSIGRAKEAMAAILDGNYSFTPSDAQYGWFGSEVIAKRYGVELIDAALEAPHDVDESRDRVSKKWFLGTVLRTLVKHELEEDLDASYVSAVKSRAARALDRLYDLGAEDALRNITDDDAFLYALAGEEDRALAFSKQHDGEIRYRRQQQDRTITAALCSIALSGSIEGLERAMDIYKSSAEEMPYGEKRLRTLLTTGVIRKGALQHLLTLEKTTPDYNWAETITTAVQIAGYRTKALPEDKVQKLFRAIIKRMKYRQAEHLAGLVDPNYLYTLRLSNIAV